MFENRKTCRVLVCTDTFDPFTVDRDDLIDGFMDSTTWEDGGDLQDYLDEATGKNGSCEWMEIELGQDEIYLVFDENEKYTSMPRSEVLVLSQGYFSIDEWLYEEDNLGNRRGHSFPVSMHPVYEDDIQGLWESILEEFEE